MCFSNTLWIMNITIQCAQCPMPSACCKNSSGWYRISSHGDPELPLGRCSSCWTTWVFQTLKMMWTSSWKLWTLQLLCCWSCTSGRRVPTFKKVDCPNAGQRWWWQRILWWVPSLCRKARHAKHSRSWIPNTIKYRCSSLQYFEAWSRFRDRGNGVPGTFWGRSWPLDSLWPGGSSKLFEVRRKQIQAPFAALWCSCMCDVEIRSHMTN